MKNPKPKAKSDDPLFGLKYIAYLRSEVPDPETMDHEVFLNFAKWQVCKVRNVLWNDPVWDAYTDEEIVIEFFAIRFDESKEFRAEFGSKLTVVKSDDYDWLERMEAKYFAEKQSTIKSDAAPQDVEPIEFEEKYE